MSSSLVAAFFNESKLGGAYHLDASFGSLEDAHHIGFSSSIRIRYTASLSLDEDWPFFSWWFFKLYSQFLAFLVKHALFIACCNFFKKRFH